jgi:hypothetical protein
LIELASTLRQAAIAFPEFAKGRRNFVGPGKGFRTATLLSQAGESFCYDGGPWAVLVMGTESVT